ncbi:MAG: hypothetical protein KC457_28870, partial [Myxococcales bacterium]|nr:hypothetical protein [Myxococcales bacterium]
MLARLSFFAGGGCIRLRRMKTVTKMGLMSLHMGWVPACSRVPFCEVLPEQCPDETGESDSSSTDETGETTATETTTETTTGETTETGPVCGDGIAEGDEACDGEDLLENT